MSYLLEHARRFEFDALNTVNGRLVVDPVSIEWRGDDKWAIVTPFGLCYGRSRRWKYERSPSNRTKRFLDAYRWSLADAVAVCERWERRAHKALADGTAVRRY